MKSLIYLLILFNISNLIAQPNIILIAADDMGWSDLGCYGSEIATPNLDWLASKGMRFRQMHNTAKCFPSRASLITGQYAQAIGFDKTHTNPLQSAVTLGEVLQTAGYRTYWSGKHHGIDNPYDRGFDHYYGLRDGACNHFNPGKRRSEEAQPAQKRPDRTWCIDSACLQGFTPIKKDFYTTDYFTHYAIDYIQEAQEMARPFFLYLAYTAPHDPLMAWPEDIAKYKGRYDKGYEVVRQKRFAKQKEIGLLDKRYQLSTATFTPWEELDEEKKRKEAQKMEVYAAMIDRLDQNIGRILDQLRQLKIMDNTMIIFVSDNGASAEVVRLDHDDDQAPIGSLASWVSLGPDWANVSNTPFRYYKNYSYEGGINTPMIVYWPKEVPQNSFTDFNSHFIDIMPTLSELATASYPSLYQGEQINPMAGRSLVKVIKGKSTKRKTPLFWEWKNGQAVRLGDWKLVKHGKENWQLYKLSKDPSETLNLSAQKPKKVRELEALFLEWKEK